VFQERLMKPALLMIALLASVATAPAFGDRYRHHGYGHDEGDRHGQDRYERQDRYGRDHRHHRDDDRRYSPRTYPRASLAKPNPPFQPKAQGWNPPY
jgi:hypothetical protein